MAVRKGRREREQAKAEFGYKRDVIARRALIDRMDQTPIELSGYQAVADRSIFLSDNGFASDLHRKKAGFTISAREMNAPLYLKPRITGERSHVHGEKVRVTDEPALRVAAARTKDLFQVREQAGVQGIGFDYLKRQDRPIKQKEIAIPLPGDYDRELVIAWSERVKGGF